MTVMEMVTLRNKTALGLSGRNLSRRSPHHALRDAGREHFLRPRPGSTCPCLWPKISSWRTLTDRRHDTGW